MPAYLSPSPKLRFYGRDGKPLSGGYLFTYDYVTSLPVATFADADMSTRNPVQIQLDANGEPSNNGLPVCIFLIKDKRYKFAWYDSEGNFIDKVEPVQCPGGDSGGGGGSVYEIAMFDISQASHGLYGDILESLGAGLLPIVQAGAAGNVRYYFYTARNEQGGTMTFTCGYDGEVQLLTLHSDGTYGYSSPTGDSVKYTLQTKNDNEKLQARLNIGAAALLSLAPAFSDSTSYNEGDVVIYNGKLYIFDSAHPAGTWTGNDIHETNIMEVLAMAVSTTEKKRYTLMAPTSAEYSFNNETRNATFNPSSTGQLACIPVSTDVVATAGFKVGLKATIKAAMCRSVKAVGIDAGAVAAAVLKIKLLAVDNLIQSVQLYNKEYVITITTWNSWEEKDIELEIPDTLPPGAVGFVMVLDSTSTFYVDDYNLQTAYVGQKMNPSLLFKVQTDKLVTILDNGSDID